MTSQVLCFISGSFEDMDNYMEVTDGHYVTAKQKGWVQIKIWKDEGDTFIATLRNVLLPPDL